MPPKTKREGKKRKTVENMRDQFFKEFNAKEKILDTPVDIQIIETTKSTCDSVDNVMDDSFSIDSLLAKYTTKETVTPKKRTRNAGKRKRNLCESYCDDLSYVIQPTKTRAASKKLLKANETDDSVIIIEDNLPQILTDTNSATKPKRKRKTNAKDSITPTTNVSPITSGRKRGGNRRNNISQLDPLVLLPDGTTRRNPRYKTRRTRSVRETPTEEYPTITIGNLAEYPDNSSNVPLFTGKTNEVIDLDDYLDQNEEISVKVHWRNREVERFNLRRFQKLKHIFEHFSDKENVGQNQLLFTYNDTIIKPDDTPESIGYNIAKFIDGGVINQAINLNRDKVISKEKGIKIKFQFKNTKRPYEISVEPDEKLSVAFMKCAEHLETSLNKLKFEFDGDYITGEFFI
ncbi:unnamed protein product [Danaus chrysippus]|uniref:(African queen) hypothetical protein n=1 Tax=Danaus chrysippus TaxID=151541 RepID=A0A8J2QXF4_9NEOP|nr:unnamed protein product [Danaus chrysippus]